MRGAVIARRIGIVLVFVPVIVTVFVTVLWAIALFVLPDAPERFRRAAPPPAKPRAAGGVLLVPIAGVARAAVRDSWGDPRDNGLRAHHGTDIAAPAGTPVRAAAAGVVEKMWVSAAGGTTLYVRSPARDWVCYYAHLSGYAAGLHEGSAVRAGDVVGYVGDTGNAGAGNFHLHFGLARTTPDQKWYDGQDMDPYPYLAGRPLPR